MVRPALGRATLVYDGDCALCRASALFVMRRTLVTDALEVLPSATAVRRERFPAISDEACRTAMQLVLPDGRVLSGADAVPELLRRMRGWRHVAWMFALPAARPVARRVYAWIARNRMRISCGVRQSRGVP